MALDLSNIDIGKLGPKVMDNILTANNAFTNIILTDNPGDFESFQMLQATQVVKPTTGGSFSAYDTMDTNATTTTAQFNYTPKYYYQNVSVSDVEITQNATDPNKAVKLVAFKIEEGANALADSVGDIFYLDGTGNSSKDFLGLKAIVDDGTVAGTIGGLSRTTYVNLKAYRAAPGTGLTSVSTIGTAVNATTIGGDTPNYMITTKALFNTFENLLTLSQFVDVSKVGYGSAGYMGKSASNGNGGNMVDAGMVAIRYRGIPIVADDKCTTNYWYLLNTKKGIKWYGQPLQSTEKEFYTSLSLGGNDQIEGVYSQSDSKNIGLVMGRFVRNTNQAVASCKIVLGGQAASLMPNRNGVVIFT